MTIQDFVDTYEYACKSWLHLELSPTQMEELTATAAASAFLFHKMILKEDKGAEITKEAADIPALTLRNKATALRLKMAGNELLRGGTSFRDYFIWIKDAVPEAQLSGTDNESLLVLSVADEVVDLILKERPKVAPTLLCEIVYLYTVHFFRMEMLISCPNQFRKCRSFPFFEATEEDFEQIRAQIID